MVLEEHTPGHLEGDIRVHHLVTRLRRSEHSSDLETIVHADLATHVLPYVSVSVETDDGSLVVEGILRHVEMPEPTLTGSRNQRFEVAVVAGRNCENDVSVGFLTLASGREVLEIALVVEEQISGKLTGLRIGIWRERYRLPFFEFAVRYVELAVPSAEEYSDFVIERQAGFPTEVARVALFHGIVDDPVVAGEALELAVRVAPIAVKPVAVVAFLLRRVRDTVAAVDERGIVTASGIEGTVLEAGKVPASESQRFAGVAVRGCRRRTPPSRRCSHRRRCNSSTCRSRCTRRCTPAVLR